ncbi:MAG TPA: exodeoxyribonuclease VII small subunit [Bacteroidota bacterium]|nr:exodeoxyribonuclease VII small subunit [Bacteroidota bacterium]
MAAKRPDSGIEASLERLQHIVRQLDDERIPLEESMKLYEEGILIVESCVRGLSETETRIQELRKRSDGVFERLNFEDDSTHE